MFCRFCGKSMHETAISCPSCGGVQNTAFVSNTGASIWMSIASMITGLLGMLALMDNSPWDMETVVGVIMISSCPAAIWGVWTLVEKRGGKNMAIAGLVMSVVVFFGCVGAGLGL